MPKLNPDTRKTLADTTNLVQEGGKNIRNFITKFNNDQVMSSAAGLAYNLILAATPIAIALIALLGLTIGQFAHKSQEQIVGYIEHAFPSALPATNILQMALTALNKNAGFLGLIAIVTAIFGGSRLFIAMEGYFDIIYRTYPRKMIRLNAMAILMLLIYIILTPIMFFASSIPALLLELVQNSELHIIPGITQLTRNVLLLDAVSISSSLIISWLLFQAIYLVVPNRKISFKKSWLGAVVAAILLELFLFLFPFYITHFMGSYTGSAGFALIFLVFFYYFAVIVLLGAEINAYFAEGIPPLPKNVAKMVSDTCGNQEMSREKEPDRS